VRVERLLVPLWTNTPISGSILGCGFKDSHRADIIDLRRGHLLVQLWIEEAHLSILGCGFKGSHRADIIDVRRGHLLVLLCIGQARLSILGCECKGSHRFIYLRMWI
jgi:hypothetical protein